MNREELIKRWIKHKPKETPVLYTSLSGVDVAIKDESKNVSSTYKAKHGWMMGLDYLQNHYPQDFIYYLGSTGNAAMADFAYADLLNDLLGETKVQVVCFYPLHYDQKLLGPDTKGRAVTGKDVRKRLESYLSGFVMQVDFDEKYWFDDFQAGNTPCLDEMNARGIHADRHNSKDITEGFSPTYTQVMEEFVEQLIGKCGHIPRALAVVQFGAGMLYDDTKEVIENLGLPIDILAVSTGNLDTIADKICDSSESWQESLEDLINTGHTFAKNSGDMIVHVSEEQIAKGLKLLSEWGMEAEPSGAAPIGLLSELDVSEYELVLFINTGNGVIEAKSKQHH